MKQLGFLLAGVLVFVVSCVPSSKSPQKITIIDGDKLVSIDRTVDTPSALLIAAGIPYTADDLFLIDGQPFGVDSHTPQEATTLQIEHSIPITFINNGLRENRQSHADTVAEFLADEGIQLRESDSLNPPASTPILGPLTVELSSASPLTVSSSTGSLDTVSSANSVGQALAEAGISLQGLDYSLPAENESMPSDGIIKVVRVSEGISLVQKTIPFNNEVQLSADLEIDQQDLLQAGEPGLAVTRTRTRYEDGQSVNQSTDAEAVVRPPKDRIIGAGTKIVLRTLDTPEGPVEYYRAVKVYATSYSPCRLGVPKCGYATAGGLKAQKGVIGVIRSWWNNMNGSPVYVPGYGRAIISDIGAGFPDKNWIDLAYSDEDYVPWHSWTTLYFLTPVPPNILYVLP